METKLKKLCALILLCISFSSCEFFKSASTIGARNPQSEDSNSDGPNVSEIANNIHEFAQKSTNISKLCSLPREYTNPVLYDQYCGQSCGAVGNSCEEHSDCCSSRCTNGTCQAGGNHFVPIGKICSQPSDCETGLCDPHPVLPYKICYGSLSKGICEFITETCTQPDNCCSRSCYKNKCIGSAKYPAGYGQPCYLEHSECSSNNCNFTTNRCR